MGHEHTPPAGETHDWADSAWAEWVDYSGTNPATRGWNFQREDLSWVYTRVIKGLEKRITKLEAEKVVRSFEGRVPWSIARISEAYGPGDRRLLKLFKGAERGISVQIGRVMTPWLFEYSRNAWHSLGSLKRMAFSQ